MIVKTSEALGYKWQQLTPFEGKTSITEMLMKNEVGDLPYLEAAAGLDEDNDPAIVINYYYDEDEEPKVWYKADAYEDNCIAGLEDISAWLRYYDAIPDETILNDFFDRNGYSKWE